MNEPTKEQIEKLPKWAREHVESLTREVSTWKDAALRFSKEQPESPFYIDDWTNGARIKQFIPSSVNTISCDYAGVHMDMFLPQDNDGQRFYGPEIRFSEIGKHTFSNVAAVPTARGIIQLVHKDNLR